MKRIIGIFTLVILLSAIGVAANPRAGSHPNTKTPHERYPELVARLISAADFYAEYDTTFIIDARSAKQYDAMHMTGATNVVSSKVSTEDLRQMVINSGHRKIVTYCSGIKCPASFQVAARLISIGFTDVYVYEDGMMAWAKLYPNKVVFQDNANPSTKTVIDRVNESENRALNGKVRQH